MNCRRETWWCGFTTLPTLPGLELMIQAILRGGITGRVVVNVRES